MANVNARLAGQRVVIVEPTSRRRFPVDSPGWGAPDAAAFLLPIEVGMTGTITDVESHGSNPWTRFGVRFDDGSHVAGLDPSVTDKPCW